VSKQPKGFVIYRGPSHLDGSPIVAIAITNSTNAKTGNMVQTYIIRADVLPTEAVKSGADAAICGDCKHRPSTGGACYVNVGQGPQSVYRAFLRGNYPDDDGYMVQTACSGRMVRLGTYGDPAAVPVEVWERILRNASGRTGYTHQWARIEGTDEGARLLGLVMASVDNEGEAEQARALGLRYFRIRTAEQPVGKGEFVCPASEEAGKRKLCATCGACDGTDRAGKASPVIIVHGSKKNRFIPIARI
jgi:hypothetical protein